MIDFESQKPAMSTKKVTCLRCQKEFPSIDPKRNRICPNCHKSKSYKEACHVHNTPKKALNE